LGELPEDGVELARGQRVTIAHTPSSDDPTVFTASYEGLIDDLAPDNMILLADGTVSLRVIERNDDEAVCKVVQPGLLRSRQGINLPGVKLRLPSLTEKDRDDLSWAIANGLDFVGLSFVRCAEDVDELRRLITEQVTACGPSIIAKIEKSEAVDDLDRIVGAADGVMVARGDLGVELDIVRLPAVQKRIIRTCNRRGIPVITATQMLDSMQRQRIPTRAEVGDVANAVLDGTDAVMLSGETAVGRYPVESVTMMSRIVQEMEPFVVPAPDILSELASHQDVEPTTRAVTLGAIRTAEQLDADLIAIVTRSGRSATAWAAMRSHVPIVALTDDPQTARRLCLAWGVRAVTAPVCRAEPQAVLEFTMEWGLQSGVLAPGDHVVLVGTSNWAQPGKDLVLVGKARSSGTP